MRKRIVIIVAAAVAVLTAAGTVAAQSIQRFSDVPPEHEAFEAIEWAADVQLTLGYGDGTFKPEEALSRWQAVVFMERFYDDILGADGDDGFTSNSFTRADMMVLLKTINDGGSPGSTSEEATTTEEPETPTGRWIPFPEDRSAQGRCAPAIVMGIYDWEQCAWGTSPDPEMSRSEMTALVEKIWAETKARGKPDQPPTLTEGYCGADVLGCYLASTHTIQLSEGFTLWTLLHELAHALISENDTMSDCDDDWTHRVPGCWHGEWYRCAADALYSRYGGIESAGVCGTPPALAPGDWFLMTPSETEWGIIHAGAWLYDTAGDYQLIVRCDTDYEHDAHKSLAMLLFLPRGASEDQLTVRTRFTGEQSTTNEQWHVSTESDDTLWPNDVSGLLQRFAGADKLHMSVEYGSRDTDRATFNLGDSPAVSEVLLSKCPFSGV